MTDEPTQDQTTEPVEAGEPEAGSQTAEPSATEPAPRVSLEEEAGSAGITTKPEPSSSTAPKPVEKTITQEQLQAEVSRAVQGALERERAKTQEAIQKGDFITREDYEADKARQAEEAELRVRAVEKMHSHLGALGINPGTDDYKAFEAKFAEMKDLGAVGQNALLTAEGVKAIAVMAGLRGSEDAKTRISRELGERAAKPYGQGHENTTADDLNAQSRDVLEAMREAMGGEVF